MINRQRNMINDFKKISQVFLLIIPAIIVVTAIDYTLLNHGFEDSISVAVTESVPFRYDSVNLQNMIEDFVSKKQGEWSVYVNALDDNCTAEVNNKQIYPASTIKLFNIASYYNEVNKGNILHSDETDGYLKEMITVSSNYDSNKVVSIIGKGNFDRGALAVTEFAHGLGCTDTQEQNRLYDVSGPAWGRNYTSVRDCGILLEKLYRGNCVSEEYDKKITDLLKKQERREKIPSGLPEGIEIANKTGETSSIELDTAIVYSDRCDFVLCIAVTDFCSNTVYREFGELACMVYEFLNN